jgi:hypothetical protein
MGTFVSSVVGDERVWVQAAKTINLGNIRLELVRVILQQVNPSNSRKPCVGVGAVTPPDEALARASSIR